MDTRLYNIGGHVNSVQVSVVGDIPEGNYKPNRNFLIKNITEEDMKVTIIPAGQQRPIETTIYVGWNPEICKEIVNAPAGLQFGF